MISAGTSVCSNRTPVRERYRLKIKERLFRENQQALNLFNHQGSLLTHSAEESAGEILLVVIIKNKQSSA